MKQLIAGLVLLVMLSPAFGQNDKTIVYDANAEVRKLSGFEGVEVSGAIDLYISQGTEEAVAVSSSSSEMLSRVRTEVRGSTLRIFFDSKGMNWKSWGNYKLKAYVTFKKISHVEASGACNVKVADVLKGTDLQIEMSGASDFKGAVSVTNLKLEMSGASKVSISGRAAKADIEANGASDFRGYDLNADYCKLDASGASVVRITVLQELNAQASGGSSIYYKGAGSIHSSNTSGGASIRRRTED